MDDLEQTIKQLLAANDPAAAVKTTLDQLGPQLLGYVTVLVRDELAAREIVTRFSQELGCHIAAFDGARSFKTWAYQLVMKAVRAYRRDHPGPTRAITGDAPLQDRVMRVRAALEPDEHVLLFLRVDQQLSWDDIAAVLAAGGDPVEVPALRERFARARQRVRDLAAE